MFDQYGRRYIAADAFLSYARHLGLFPDHPDERLLEFLDRNEILRPVARIRFPPSIVRRWFKDDHPSEHVPQPISHRTSAFQAASRLRHAIFFHTWDHPKVYGERLHVLDDLPSEYRRYVRFHDAAFQPWEDLRTIVARHGDRDIGDSRLGEGIGLPYRLQTTSIPKPRSSAARSERSSAGPL